MFILLTGGSGSGKSACAEDYALRLSGGKKRYYIATMQIYDEEGAERVRRHREQRADKGFITIEQPVSVAEALKKMNRSEEKSCTALLECVSNLVANEMFSEDGIRSPEEVRNKVMGDIRRLGENLENLIIVTNNVFEAECDWEDDTREYMSALGEINRELASMADEVAEVVVGIPVWRKKRGNEICV